MNFTLGSTSASILRSHPAANRLAMQAAAFRPFTDKHLYSAAHGLCRRFTGYLHELVRLTTSIASPEARLVSLTSLARTVSFTDFRTNIELLMITWSSVSFIFYKTVVIVAVYSRTTCTVNNTN